MDNFELDFAELFLAFDNNEPRLCVFNNSKNKIKFLSSKKIVKLSDADFVSPSVRIIDNDSCCAITIRTCSLADILKGNICELQPETRLLCLKDEHFKSFKKLKNYGSKLPIKYFIAAEEKLVNEYNKQKRKIANNITNNSADFFEF